MERNDDSTYIGFSGEHSPVCPDTGNPMYEITSDFLDLPSGIEIWECTETRSIYIRVTAFPESIKPDYTGDELNQIREIGRSILV